PGIRIGRPLDFSRYQGMDGDRFIPGAGAAGSTAAGAWARTRPVAGRRAVGHGRRLSVPGSQSPVVTRT
ncbi:hypothetical protein, partial [Streptomyces griseus]|uniref:hypothetical protein n=1 Tax=Streptomyces griseus TaxID=1911 RepID=UPI0033D39783